MTRTRENERSFTSAVHLGVFLLLLGFANGCAISFFDSLDSRQPRRELIDALGDGDVLSRPPLDDATARVLNRLLPADTLVGQFVIQQRVTVRWSTPEGPEEARFEAALQRRGDALLLLGFGPMKQVGFELWLKDGSVRFENRTGREVPFRPEDILADVQRVFYPWLDPATDCTECERHGPRLSLDVEERIGKERLEEREFSLRGRPELGVVRLRYSGEPLFGIVPRLCLVTNEWFGYSLKIESDRVDRIDDASHDDLSDRSF